MDQQSTATKQSSVERTGEQSADQSAVEITIEEEILKKLEKINRDHECLIKQLQNISRDPVKSIEDAVEKTVVRVSTLQINTIEKLNNIQTKIEKVSGNSSRLSHLQKELKTEVTNRTYLQNELSKDLDELIQFIKSGRSPVKLISEKLNDFAKELFMIGVSQNELKSNLEDYKLKLMNEIKKMTIDLSLVIDKNLENDDDKIKILDKIKAVQETK